MAAIGFSQARRALRIDTPLGYEVEAGFVAAGLFEYTYGHSLGLIRVGIAALSPLTAEPR